MSAPLEKRLQHLRAAAESTRLRLLAVLSQAEFTVTDLTQLLGQSQPRVSRHLKLLCDSGLLLRSREQHWIYYRVPVEGEGAEFVRALLALLAPDDAVLALDCERAGALLARRAADTAPVQTDDARNDDDEARELGAVLDAELGERDFGSILYVGAAPAAVLGVLAGRARRAVGLSRSREDVRRARALLHGQGLTHCELQQGELRSMPFAAGSFDVVVVDRMPGPGVELLREGARVLRGDGRLVVIEDYERLEAAAAGANPLHASREQLARAGLHCTRLRPLDLANSRLLLALGAPDPRRDVAA
ncbi:MAG TPA: metalloregulator ArsR/SmtB family transcription factor [Steroidobacteraceae bacterium]